MIGGEFQAKMQHEQFRHMQLNADPLNMQQENINQNYQTAMEEIPDPHQSSRCTHSLETSNTSWHTRQIL